MAHKIWEKYFGYDLALAYVRLMTRSCFRSIRQLLNNAIRMNTRV